MQHDWVLHHNGATQWVALRAPAQWDIAWAASVHFDMEIDAQKQLSFPNEESTLLLSMSMGDGVESSLN